MIVRSIRSTDEFLAERDRWNDLVEHGVTRHAYLRHEWFTAWWAAFGAGAELAIAVASNGGRWLAVAPLCVAPRRLGPFRVLSLEFIYSHIGPRCEFILREESPELVTALVRHVAEAPPRWTLGALHTIPEDSPTFRLLPGALHAQGIRVVQMPGRVSPALHIRGTWDEYLASLSQSRRYELKRAWRETEKLGEAVAVLEMTRRDEILAYLPRLYDVSARSWKGGAGTDMGASEPARRFYHALCDELGAAGRLVVWALEVDRKTVAMMFCLREPGGVIEMRFDFDNDLRKAAPGNALMGRVLQSCFEQGMAEHDFGGAAYAYKLALADHVRQHCVLEIYQRRPLPLFIQAARRVKRGLLYTLRTAIRPARKETPTGKT